MWDVQAVVDLVDKAAGFYSNHVPADSVPYPNALAGGAVALGLLLAFWGSRLLRTMYILSFMAAGGAMGVRLQHYMEIETLTGLTLGAGIAGFLGFLFYRWWVGVTAGTLAVAVVLLVAQPRIEAELQGYSDYSQGVAGEYVLPPAGSQELGADAMAARYVLGLKDYLWGQRRPFAVRLVLAVGLAWMLGTAAGLLLPRLTTILGTSALGVVLLAAGSGVLLYRNWPNAWDSLTARPGVLLLGIAGVFLLAVLKQGRGSRIRIAAPPPAAAPPATAKG